MEYFQDGFRGAIQMLVTGDPLVWDAAWRSTWISCAAVLLAGLLGIGLALLLIQSRLWGRAGILVLCRTGMSLPTVFIGLVCYGLLSRRGPLGSWDLLYTSWAIVLGEMALALPIIVTWSHRALAGLDPRVSETALTLGAGPWRRSVTLLWEAWPGILLALLTAFARCVTELGIAMMVGGNLKFRTRTLTTATALETARGEFERGMAMSLILLAIAGSVTLLMTWLGRDQGDR